MGARPRWAGNRGTGMMAAKGRTGVKRRETEGREGRGGEGDTRRVAEVEIK